MTLKVHGCSCDTSEVIPLTLMEAGLKIGVDLKLGLVMTTTDYLNGGKFTLLLVLNFMCCHIM